MLSLTNKKGGSRMKILNEVIKEKPDSKHIDLCCKRRDSNILESLKNFGSNKKNERISF